MVFTDLREDQMTEASFKKLSDRLMASQPMPEIAKFQDAPRNYHQNDVSRDTIARSSRPHHFPAACM
jgi:hypothetical protein